jgi:predicted alpha/beta superfamily hydrolase
MDRVKLIFIAILIIFFSEFVNAQQQIPSDKFKEVEKVTYHSQILNENRELYVYAPKGEPNKKYPVIYLLDGEVIDNYKEALLFSKSNPLIIVGIANRKNRNRDLIPVSIESRIGSGEAESFRNFLIMELEPYINKHYSTNGENILYGASNAGLFTFYTMLTTPEKFKAFISSSATVGHCYKYMTKLLGNNELKSGLKNKKLFIHYGKKDHLPHVINFLPKYIELLKTEIGSQVHIKSIALENGVHVPPNGVLDGLKFIYNQK